MSEHYEWFDNKGIKHFVRPGGIGCHQKCWQEMADELLRLAPLAPLLDPEWTEDAVSDDRDRLIAELDGVLIAVHEWHDARCAVLRLGLASEGRTEKEESAAILRYAIAQDALAVIAEETPAALARYRTTRDANTQTGEPNG